MSILLFCLEILKGEWTNTFKKLSLRQIIRWPLMLPPSEEITLYIRHSIRMTSVNEAWRYLLREARKISRAENIEPHELILSMIVIKSFCRDILNNFRQ